MFRFIAINNSTRRCFTLSSSSKPPLSTLSCNLALRSDDDTCMSSGNNTYTPSTVVSACTASITNTIQSPLCNIIAKLSGDATSLASLNCSLSHNNHNNIIWAEDVAALSPNLPVFEVEESEEEEETPQSLSLWLISTLKRRKKMMNKHKLRKRRKKLRLKTRK